MRNLFRAILIVVFALIPTSLTNAQALGQWSPVYDWSCQFSANNCPNPEDTDELSHACLIPYGPLQGKVLLWRMICPPGHNYPATTETWIFDPESPEYLAKVTQTLDSVIFCSGASWDPVGNLIVAAGVGTPTFPRETYKFRTNVLTGIDYATAEPDPCVTPPTVGTTAPAWRRLGDLLMRRYYPTMITLLRRVIVNLSNPPIPGGASLVIGGPWRRPGMAGDSIPMNYVGNEWWELLPPNSQTWREPIYPSPNPAPLPPPNTPTLPTPPTPPATFEDYNLYQGGGMSYFPEVLFDSYPHAFQLADIGPNSKYKGNILITSDTETAFNSVPTLPGRVWLIRTPQSSTPSNPDWQLWSIAQAGNSVGPGTNERFYGPAVLMHRSIANGGLNRVLVFGGSQNQGFQYVQGQSQAVGANWMVNDTVQEFVAGTDPAAQVAPWIFLAIMRKARVYLNAVILANGKIFLVGGAESYVHPGITTAGTTLPVTVPELYDPGTATVPSSSILLAPSTTPPGFNFPTPRLYHGLAVLLPDGRVLVAGGHDHNQSGYPSSKFTGEVYSPDYIALGLPRPLVISGSSEQPFFDPGPGADTFELYYESPAPIDQVVLLRPGAVTHHFDCDQRLIELDFVAPGFGLDPLPPVVVTRPAEDLGPPGWYMLFLVTIDNSTGTPVRVPSVAHWIRFY